MYTNYFRSIRVLDSTHFQVSDKFASRYQGSGGSGHSAGVKIQLEYDLLSGQFLHVHVGSGKQNDKIYGSTCLTSLQPHDVCIRDLGYFDLKRFTNDRRVWCLFYFTIKAQYTYI